MFFYVLSEFPKRLRKLMEERDLSQFRLGLDADINQQTIWTYVHDVRMPSVHKLVSLAEALHVSTDYLLGLTFDDDEEDIGAIIRYMFPDLTEHQIMIITSIIIHYRMMN